MLRHLRRLAASFNKCRAVSGEQVSFGSAEIADEKVRRNVPLLSGAERSLRVAEKSGGRGAGLQFTKIGCDYRTHLFVPICNASKLSIRRGQSERVCFRVKRCTKEHRALQAGAKQKS